MQAKTLPVTFTLLTLLLLTARPRVLSVPRHPTIEDGELGSEVGGLGLVGILFDLGLYRTW